MVAYKLLKQQFCDPTTISIETSTNAQLNKFISTNDYGVKHVLI